MIDFFRNSLFIWPNKLNKQTAQVHTVLLRLYVADPATFLASNSVVGTLFSSETNLFIQFTPPPKKNISEIVRIPH